MGYRKMRIDSPGKRLRDLRTDAGLTQDELTDEIERVSGVRIGQNAISQMENDRSHPSMPVAIALAKVLHTTLDFLMMLTHDPEVPNEEPERYISPQADEAARLIDAMDAEARNQVLAIVRRVADPVTGGSSRAQDVAYLLKSVEMALGLEARRIMERALLSGNAPGTGND